MLSRADLEQREALFLAPYARRSQDAQRREPEPESEHRTAFQKDRDRVLHTKAFRRLEAKTQVFVRAEALGDHYRNRLTHTLEVQQVARTLALTLGLNETLAETLALAHDLGHPPFGHAGERTLDALMSGHGGFNHNAQAQRIVTLLEERSYGRTGLNLTLDTLDGLNKHQRAELPPEQHWSSLEAQIVDAADALAYTAHDLDDGLRSGLLRAEELQELGLWREWQDRLGPLSAPPSSSQMRTLQSELIGFLVSDLAANTDATIRASGVSDAGAVQAYPTRLVTYSSALREPLREMGLFLSERLYHHWQIEQQVYRGERVLTDLFRILTERPSLLPPRPRARLSRDGLERTVCNHLAGMTDRYALDLHAALGGH